jgi:hypothetical protein
LSSSASLTVQEPPFTVPFVDKSGLMNTVWQNWFINFFNSQNGQNAAFAPVASPAFTGTPTAPTPGAGTNDSQIATTHYADRAVATETARAEGAEGALAASLNNTNANLAAETARAEAAEALLAPINNPTFTGSVTEPYAVLTGATPTVAAGQLGLGSTTAATATGGAGTLPAAPVAFIVVNVAGTVGKVPYYAT